MKKSPMPEMDVSNYYLNFTGILFRKHWMLKSRTKLESSDPEDLWFVVEKFELTIVRVFFLLISGRLFLPRFCRFLLLLGRWSR